MVTVGGQKMGKSLGNFTTLKDAFKKWRPEIIRFFILQSHYRSTLDFSDDAVEAASTGLLRLSNTFQALRERISDARSLQGNTPLDLSSYRGEFLRAMDDDFNTPQAIAVMYDLSREVNTLLNQDNGLDAAHAAHVAELFDELLGKILGIRFETMSAEPDLDDGLMKLIIELRQELRVRKLWDMSDKIRDALAALGIAIEDKKERTSWRKVR
jgi:cysteinyl-tRNA synthetase